MQIPCLSTQHFLLHRHAVGCIERYVFWTLQVIDKARWMHTGDIAVLDEIGYCKIVGRLKDMIIRGGENISPTQVEEIIHQHPSVLDVQVTSETCIQRRSAFATFVERGHPKVLCTFHPSMYALLQLYLVLASVYLLLQCL